MSKPRVGFVNFYGGFGNPEPTIHETSRDAHHSAEDSYTDSAVPFVECTPEVLRILQEGGFCPFINGRELLS